MDAQKIEVESLCPTQITVGMREVADKRRELAHMSKDERHDFLKHRPIPVVIGPAQRQYLIDHHHLARALWDDAFEHAWITVIADLSQHHADDFWKAMAQRRWVYPHDAQGRVQQVTALPPQVAELVDDPYRSLAGYVRKAGGFVKDETPFAEFAWANFFRSHLRIGEGDSGFAAAVKEALVMAHSSAAATLPGYQGAKTKSSG